MSEVGLFRDEECIRRYREDWESTEKWHRTITTDVFALRVARAMQQLHIGVTISTPEKPIGSGVLVKSSKGYGILTAGHVCTLLENELRSLEFIHVFSHGAREPFEPGAGTSIHSYPLLRKFLRIEKGYTKNCPVPDYGCIVLPKVLGVGTEARLTFTNIENGPSVQDKDYELEHNVWVCAGFLEEKSAPGRVFVSYAFGSPRAVYARDRRHYLYLRAQELITDRPQRLNGMSGCGLWELPVRGRKEQPDDEHSIGRPLLRGIAFCQEKSGKGEPLSFYAHELLTISEDVVSWLAA